MKLLFIDTSPKFAREILKKIPTATTWTGDVTKLKLDGVTAYLSPANSYGYMGGGIDRMYNKMFSPAPDSATRVFDKIASCDQVIKGKIAKLGRGGRRGQLPIGGAMLTKLDFSPHNRDDYLVTAPTMVTPGQIVGTDYPYRAMLATLTLIDKSGVEIDTLVVPGLGTGTGKISFDESAKQISLAIHNFGEGMRAPDRTNDRMMLMP